jgi:hypothetical protein
MARRYYERGRPGLRRIASAGFRLEVAAEGEVEVDAVLQALVAQADQAVPLASQPQVAFAVFEQGPRHQRVGVVGDALTVEPGLYALGVGGVRIEDLVVVTADGCENLNTLHESLDWR